MMGRPQHAGMLEWVCVSMCAVMPTAGGCDERSSASSIIPP